MTDKISQLKQYIESLVPEKLTKTESNFLQFANYSLDWWGLDSAESYQQNLVDRYQSMKYNGWINTPITYKFNSQGFRTNEFNHNPSIMFVGCSNTFGDGLPKEHRWSDLVAKNLSLETVNLGISGGSSDSSFRLTYHWISKIKPKIIIFLEPPSSRIELLLENTHGNNISLQWPTQEQSVRYGDFLKVWAMSDNSALNLLKNRLAIEGLATQQKIKFYYFSNQEYYICIDNVNDFARDLCHRGTGTNRNFANYVLGKI